MPAIFKTKNGDRTVAEMRAELVHSDGNWAKKSAQEVIDGYAGTTKQKVTRNREVEGVPEVGKDGNTPMTGAANGQAARTPGANGKVPVNAVTGKAPPTSLPDGSTPAWKPNGDGTFYTDDGLYFDTKGKVQDSRSEGSRNTTKQPASTPSTNQSAVVGQPDVGATKKGEASYGYGSSADEGNGGDFAESDKANAAAGGHGYGQVDAPSPFGYNRDVFNAQHPSYAGGFYDPKTGKYDSPSEKPFQIAGPHGMETIGTGKPTAPPGVNSAPYLNPTGPVSIDPATGKSTFTPGSSGNVPGSAIPGYTGGAGANLPPASPNPSWSTVATANPGGFNPATGATGFTPASGGPGVPKNEYGEIAPDGMVHVVDANTGQILRTETWAQNQSGIPTQDFNKDVAGGAIQSPSNWGAPSASQGTSIDGGGLPGFGPSMALGADFASQGGQGYSNPADQDFQGQGAFSPAEAAKDEEDQEGNGSSNVQ